MADAFERSVRDDRRDVARSRALPEHARPSADVARARSRPRSRRSARLDLRRGLTHVGPASRRSRDHDHARRHRATCARSARPASSARAAIALRMLEAATFTERTGARAAVPARRSVRRARRATLGARSRSARRADGLGQTMLAVPRESDIPAEFTGLERVRVCGRRQIARVRGRMSERKKKKHRGDRQHRRERAAARAGSRSASSRRRSIPEWPSWSGPQIAAVTTPQSITANGTLFVAGDDERVDERAVAARAGAAAIAEREGGSGAGPADPLAAGVAERRTKRP